jgi:hypothetical protein
VLVGAALLLAAIVLALAQFAGASWQGAWLVAGGPWPLALAGSVLVVLGAAGLLLWRLCLPLYATLAQASRAQASRTLVAGLGGFILLDVIVAGAAHPLGALLILGLYPLFRMVGASIRMD